MRALVLLLSLAGYSCYVTPAMASDPVPVEELQLVADPAAPRGGRLIDFLVRCSASNGGYLIGEWQATNDTRYYGRQDLRFSKIGDQYRVESRNHQTVKDWKEIRLVSSTKDRIELSSSGSISLTYDPSSKILSGNWERSDGRFRGIMRFRLTNCS